jgi:hypothetical protein
MTTIALPRAFSGKPVTADDWNRLVDAIQQCLVTQVTGEAELYRTVNGTVLAVLGSQSQPILICKTVGRHDAGIAQAVNLYTVDLTGHATQQLDQSANPIQVQAYNRIANLAGGVWAYITDLEGSGTIYEIISANPCDFGNTGGPN